MHLEQLQDEAIAVALLGKPSSFCAIGGISPDDMLLLTQRTILPRAALEHSRFLSRFVNTLDFLPKAGRAGFTGSKPVCGGLSMP